MSEQSFDFDDLSVIEIPVKIKGKRYVLREASGDAAGRYRSASLHGVEISHGEDGERTIRKIESIADVEPLLISRCLYKADGDGVVPLLADGEPDPNGLVPMETIKRWPAKVQKRLFEKAKEISELDEREDLDSLKKQHARLGKRIARLEEGAEKNAPSGTPAGSV